MNQLSEKIKSSLLDIILASTFHGYPSVFRTQRWLFKIMWLLLSLTFTAFCVYFSTKNFLDYLQYGFVTSIDEIYEQKSEFPTISICRARDSQNDTFDLQITDCYFNSDNICLNKTIYFQEFYDSYYGKCYRFNGGKNLYNQSIDILNSSFPGHRYGLRLELYVEPSKSNELIVHIHNKSSPPNDLYFEEYSISSGSFNYFPIRRTLSQNLEAPYGNCLKNIDSFNLNKTIINYIRQTLKVAYSQELCMSLFRNLYYKEIASCNCGSTLALEQVLQDCFFLNTNQTIVGCSSRFFETFSRDDFYDEYANYCPLECEIMSISTEPYTRVVNLNSNFTGGYIRKPVFNTYDKFMTSFYSIIVFYRDIKYSLQVQQPKAQFFDLVSNIGGLSGVFIGISFLSFVEIVELVLEFFFIYFEFKFKFNKTTRVMIHNS